jgi:AcrR family transcriptional regulator
VALTAPRWNRLEHDERRAQILAVARRLFGERPFSAVPAEEIARAAGITRGLLHHYFGTKRDLYLAVVAEMVRPPTDPVAPPEPGRPLEQVVDESVDLWLDLVERNRETWFSSLGTGGFGRDPELEAIVSHAREETVSLIISTLGLEVGGDGHELRAVLRTYGSVAETATREWLRHGSLTRPQVHALLTTTLLAMVRDVVPAVADAGVGGERGGTVPMTRSRP